MLTKPKSSLMLSMILVISTPLVLSFLSITLYPDWRFDNIPVHATIEALGTFAALIISSFIWSMMKHNRLPSRYLWVILALTSMGLLDGAHALLHAGQSFVWLHSIATFAGGFFFSLVVLPDSIQNRIRSNGLIIVIVGGITLIIALLAVVFPNAFPAMIEGGHFTAASRFINFGGGVGFLIGTSYFAFTYIKGNKEEGIVFANHCLLFGVAGMLFEISTLWDGSWWIWHVLRFIAYVVVLYYFYMVFRSLQDSLVESENQLTLLLNSTGEAIYGVDIKGDCTFANRTCLELLQVDSVDDLIGKNMHELIHHSYPDGSKYPVEESNIYRAHIHGINLHVDDEVFWRPNGESFPVEYFSHPIINNNEIIGSVVAFSDITERKFTEKALNNMNTELELRVKKRTDELLIAKEVAEKASQAKSEFLSRTSHELRTPLNAVLGFSQLLNMEDINDTQKEFVKQINTAGSHLLELVNEILDLSRIESGELRLERVSIYVPHVIEECVSLIFQLAKDNDIALKCTQMDESNPNLNTRGDPMYLKQILINLMSNAVKYNKPNGEIHVDLVSYDAMIEISIRDTGIGIKKSEQDSVFDLFTRLDSGLGQEGTGLGLTISLQLARLMGGDITLSSQVGVGSTFTLLLPRFDS